MLDFYDYHPTADLNSIFQKSLKWNSLQHCKAVADLCMFYKIRNNCVNIDIPPILVESIKHNCHYNHIHSDAF